LQLREFLGVHETQDATALPRMAEGILTRRSTIGTVQSMLSLSRRSDSAAAWHVRVEETVRKLCDEVQNSFEIFALRRWMRRHHDDESSLAAFFCLFRSLAPHVVDDAELSCFSRAWTAKVYHNAAKHIPKMIWVASFSDKAGVKGMQRFMQQWEHAEETLSTDDCQIVDILDERDRGPFLFWLLNERIFLLRALLANPHLALNANFTRACSLQRSLAHAPTEMATI
jgi:hypothetical protein